MESTANRARVVRDLRRGGDVDYVPSWVERRLDPDDIGVSGLDRFGKGIRGRGIKERETDSALRLDPT